MMTPKHVFPLKLGIGSASAVLLRLRLPALLALAQLTACTSPPKTAQATGPADFSETKAGQTETIVYPRAELPLAVKFLSKCPISDRGSVEATPVVAVALAAMSSLAETIVPSTVGFLYDKGVGILRERQLRLYASSTAFASTTFYATDGTNKLGFGCIVLARGAFSPSPMEHPVVPISMQSNSNWKTYWNEGTRDQAKDVGLAGPPELYVELALEPVASPLLTIKDPRTGKEKTVPGPTTHLKLSPVLVDYFGSGAKDTRSGKKNVTVDFKLESVAMPDARVLYSRQYDFGSLAVGQRHWTQYMDGDIVALPSRQQSSTGPVDLVPVKVTAVITEGEPGRDLSRTVAKALGEDQARKAFVDSVAGQVVDKIKANLNKSEVGKGESNTKESDKKESSQKQNKK